MPLLPAKEGERKVGVSQVRVSGRWALTCIHTTSDDDDVAREIGHVLFRELEDVFLAAVHLGRSGEEAMTKLRVTGRIFVAKWPLTVGGYVE